MPAAPHDGSGHGQGTVYKYVHSNARLMSVQIAPGCCAVEPRRTSQHRTAGDTIRAVVVVVVVGGGSAMRVYRNVFAKCA